MILKYCKKQLKNYTEMKAKIPQNIFTLNICSTNCFDSSSSFRQVVELHRFPAINVPAKKRPTFL